MPMIQRKLSFIWLCLLYANLLIHSASPDSQWEAVYPGLNDQITALSQDNSLKLNFNHAITALGQWLAGSSSQVKEAMELILQKPYYKAEQALLRKTIQLDGKEDDWQGINHQVKDETGDSFQKRADMDITAANAFLDADNNLYILIRFKAQPATRERIDVLIDLYGSEDYDYQFLIYGWEDGKVYSGFYDLHTNKAVDLSADYKAQSNVEIKIPLKNLEQPGERITLLARCFDAKATVIDSTARLTLHTNLLNYPLLLLLALLEKDYSLKDDAIGAAIALANSYLYELGDKETRQQVIADNREQFRFYRETVNWQAEQGVKYGLNRAGVLPKICWADRSSYYLQEIQGAMQKFKTGGRLTLAIYNEFADRIEWIRELQQVIKKEQLVSPALPAAAKVLEDYVHLKRVYRSSIENLVDFNKRQIYPDDELHRAQEEIKRGEYETEYFGKKRRWDDFRWLNYQCRLFKEKGIFRGDCGDTTVVQMGFYRAAGIAPLSFQWIHKGGLAAFTHNFPAYYNPLRSRWYSIQKPVFYLPGGSTTENIEVFFHFIKPAWHSWFYKSDMELKQNGKTITIYAPYYQGELTVSNRLVNFLNLGIPEQKFNNIFFSEITMQPGFFFNDTTAPLIVQDTDFDGIADSVEKELGLNPGTADSDGDGFTDSWELDNGTEALNADSPANKTQAAIDGIQRKDYEAEDMVSVYDPEGDSKAVAEIYDIKNFGAKVSGNFLYLAVNYYNPVKANSGTRCHSFLITAGRREQESYWVQWYNSYLQVFDARAADDRQWIRLQAGGAYETATLHAAEFLIPLSLIKHKEPLFIQYYAGGYTDKKQTFDVSCDYTEALRLPLAPDPLYGLAEETRNRGALYADQPGDFKQVRYIKDIKALTTAVAGQRLVCCVDYFRAKEAPYGIHSFLIKSRQNQLNYWVQWVSINSVRVWNWKDEETSREITVDASAFASLPYREGYAFIFPQDFFAEEDVLYIQYQEGSYDAQDIFISDADKIDKIRICMNTDTLNRLSAQQPVNSVTVKDPQQDYKGSVEYHDISAFTVAVYREYLLCTSAFYNRVNDIPAGIQTIYIRDPEAKRNWWVQWWELGYMKYYTWKDGENRQPRDSWLNLFDIQYGNNGYSFLIPLQILSDSPPDQAEKKKQEKTLEIVYYAGACDKNGSTLYNADITEKLSLKIAF